MRRIVAATGAVVCLLAVPSTVRAVTFTVTNTNDTGSGSLRQAILEANASLVRPHRIEFAVPGPGVHRITPLTDLPSLPAQTTVDGFTQPGSSPNTLADGSNANLLIELRGPGVGGHGLTTGGTDTIRGLVINGWNGAGSAGIYAPYAGGLIQGCYIGTDAAGTAAIPNSIGILNSQGINIGSSGVSTLTATGARNVISGNTDDGIRSTGAGPTCVIAGNYIGVNATGIAVLGNGGDGVELNNANNTSLGDYSLVPIPGLSYGNVIGGNEGNGLHLTGALANCSAVLVYIGTDRSGTIPLGNVGHGVLIENGASANALGIGATVVVIAFNGGGGIVVRGSGVGNTWRGVSIYGNTGPNIDVGDDGRVANDACDADTGPNDLMNRPILTGFTTPSGAPHAQGSLEIVPNTYHTVEYYLSASCSPNNPSLGRATGDYLAVVGTSACSKTFDHTLTQLNANRQPGEDSLTAVATESGLSTRGSSEVSDCFQLPPLSVPGVDLRLQKTASPDPATEGLPLAYTLTVTNIGQTTATGVTLTDSVPPGSTFKSASAGCSHASGTVTCNLGSVSGNGGFTTSIVTVTPTAPGVLQNTATVASVQADAHPPDNTAQATTPVAAANYDLTVGGQAPTVTCGPVTKKQTCDIAGAPSFLNGGNDYFTGALQVRSTCKKIGTTAVSCKLKGVLTVGSLDLAGVPAHSIGTYLSTDAAFDASDKPIRSAPTSLLAALAPKGKAVKIKYTHPKGQTYTNQYILLVLDNLFEVGEVDESNNVLVIGPLP